MTRGKKKNKYGSLCVCVCVCVPARAKEQEEMEIKLSVLFGNFSKSQVEQILKHKRSSHLFTYRSKGTFENGK